MRRFNAVNRKSIVWADTKWKEVKMIIGARLFSDISGGDLNCTTTAQSSDTPHYSSEVVFSLTVSINVQTNYLTSSSRLLPWEADGSSDFQEFPRILWTQKVHRRIQNSPQNSHNMSQKNLFHDIAS